MGCLRCLKTVATETIAFTMKLRANLGSDLALLTLGEPL